MINFDIHIDTIQKHDIFTQWRSVCELLNSDVQDVFDQAVPMVYYCRNK